MFEDLHDYMQSLAVIQSLKPARIYPGHGPVVSDPDTHVRMYIDHRNGRERQILSALASGKADQLFSAMDLVHIIYTVCVFLLYDTVGWVTRRVLLVCWW